MPRRSALAVAAASVLGACTRPAPEPSPTSPSALPPTSGSAATGTTTPALPAPEPPISPAVVALTIDDYPRPTLEILVPLLAARRLPWTSALNADTVDDGYRYAPWSTGLSWANVAALPSASVEVANHGASHRDITDPAAVDAEITGSPARLRAAPPARVVQGWVPPGCDYPGLALKTPPQARGIADYQSSVAGRSILNDHAWALGQDRRPQDPVGPVITWPRDGHPVPVPGRQWLDFPHGAGLQSGGDPAGGFGGLCVAAAIARGARNDPGPAYRPPRRPGWADRDDLGQLSGCLDRLTGLRDAGRIAVVRVSDWMSAKVVAR
ncbi:MAG: polysaccharide deacetylase family protein [Dermatophilaceae bacterium]